MNYLNIANNIVAAFISALGIASIAWMVSWVRNLLLERKLKQAINPNGVGVEYDRSKNRATFRLQVHNYANATIRVRTIVLMADKGHVELKPAPNKSIYQTPLSNEIVRQKFDRKHLTKGSIEPDTNANAMLLPPKTMGIWEIRSEAITSREWIFQDVFMAFEYATIFGNSALVRMAAPSSTLRLVKENFEPLMRAIYRDEPYDIFQLHKQTPKKT